jgi:hypothetical protein
LAEEKYYEGIGFVFRGWWGKGLEIFEEGVDSLAFGGREVGFR